MHKWSLFRLSQLMQVAPPISPDIMIHGVAVDTRLVAQSNLFFALPGAKVDGHEFLAEAAQKGALAAVVKTSYEGPDYGLCLMRVHDPLNALQYLSKITLQGSKSTVVAVTGSVGKTTTKEFIVALLRTKLRVAYSPGNSNSQIGLPLSILNHTQGDEDVVVLEMGMTHSGQITQLLEIAIPDIAVITAVELAHACNFDSLNDIGRAKAEILAHPKTGVGIIAKDIQNYSEISKIGNARKVSFSINDSTADFFLDDTTQEIKIVHQQRAVNIPAFGIPGRHNLHNMLAAVIVAKELGMTWKEIQQALPKLSLPERRLQHIEKGGILFINDAYNASEASLKASLACMPIPKPGKKRIAVIGQMVELGKFSESCHKSVGEAAISVVDSMICLGKSCEPIVDSWKKASKPVIWCESLDEVVEALKLQMESGDVVLLKGANSNNLWKVLPALELE